MNSPDFQLKSYMQIVEASLAAGYLLLPVADMFNEPLKPPFIVLRHDVDRRPENALEMAKAEAALGVRASYYFRSVPSSFDPAVIRAIHDMGHEIGYHYEDWHAASYQKEKAIELFKTNLAQLRELAPVETICMHGSPLAKEGNMTIWQHFDFTDHGVRDCILSHDYSDFAFFTDSGRTFGATGANLRDELGNAKLFPSVRTSRDLQAFVAAKRHDKIMLSCHPERWNAQPVGWVTQFAKDQATNTIKRGLRVVRGVR